MTICGIRSAGSGHDIDQRLLWQSRGIARAVPLDSAREEIGTSSKDPDATRQGGDQVVDLARTSIDLR